MVDVEIIDPNMDDVQKIDLQDIFDDFKSSIKDVFEENNAFSKKTAIEKSSFQELFQNKNLKFYFWQLRTSRMIIKYRKRYYYSIRNDVNPTARMFSVLIRTIGIGFLCLAILFGVLSIYFFFQ